MRLVMATRKSALALAQARAFARALEAAAGVTVAELHVVTSGDRTQDRPLYDIGGKGLFVKELEEALIDGRADFAVHSIKDVPAALTPGLSIAAVPEREDPRDVLVARGGATLAELPVGARVGTSSLRRAAYLLAARPDLRVEALRGNVDTRLRRVDEGALDAIVLARAGLNRLGLGERAMDTLPTDVCLPAVGQGALGIECRDGDGPTLAALRTVAHTETELCVAAERAVLMAVEGSCRTPLAAFAELGPAGFRLRAMLAREDGTGMQVGVASRSSVPSLAEATRLGDALGRDLAEKVRGGA